ncbi:MAG: caspase family protein [Saprospiraceae bacterium]|nr:caspase family protein [Saprospiraceae bacterium]
MNKLAQQASLPVPKPKGFQWVLCLSAFWFITHQNIQAQSCIRGNCLNGFGSYLFASKARYTGEFQSGKMHGKGVFYYSNGSKYLGNWYHGKRHGEGKMVFKNGNQYTGGFIADKMQGTGTMEFADGHRYTGEWMDDSPNGKGSLYQKSGERYEGQFLKGVFEGKGRYFYSDGSHYNGDWKNGKRHGYGEYTDAKGKILSGDWVEDKPIRVLDESEPIADMKLLSADSSKVQLTQSENALPNCNKTFCKSGKGILDYADGSKYVGEFSNGEAKGQGICYYANGDRYEGDWENHAPHGEGTMYFKSGLVYGAIWKNGEAIKQLHHKKEFVLDETVQIDQNDEVKIWAVIVGVSRYEHMPTLKYSDDDAYRMYAFYKSPEGGALPESQIRILVDEDASRLNILKAMNELYLKADDNDMVVLYFSGHGLEGTFLPIDYDGYQNAITHDEVINLFSKSKARHKICYADACHSGSLLAAKGPYASSLMFFYEELDKSSGGSAFVMSSKAREFSLEDGGLRQGIFSHYLIRGLKGEADLDTNKTITIRELFDFVYGRVREYTGLAQTPMIAGDYDEKMPVGFIR